MKLHPILLCLVALIAPGNVQSSVAAEEPKPGAYAHFVNWVRLVSDPARYQGKRVVLHGWLTVYLDHEKGASFVLWLTKEALDYRDTSARVVLEESSMIKLMPVQEARYTWQLLNHDYVRIVGRYEASGDPDDDGPGMLKAIETLQQVKPGEPISTGRPNR